MYKIIRRSLYALFFILIIGTAFVGNYFFNYALNPAIEKEKVLNQDKDGAKDENLENNKIWFEATAKEVTNKSVLGYNLVGYKFINPDSDKWVFVVHGYTSQAKNMATYIKNFYDMGYNVFAPDLLAHGKSEGKYYSMGGYDSKDLANWIKYISNMYSRPDIALFGVSMGAATVMNTLDENLDENIKVVIEDSGYINLDKEFTYQLKKLFGLPKFPIIPSASIVSKIRAGYLLTEVDAKKALENTTLPLLVLQGDEDGFVPPKYAQEVYDIAGSKDKYIKTFPKAKHVQASYLYPDEYWNTVKEFLEKHFK